MRSRPELALQTNLRSRSHEHRVQFYGSDDFLAHAVADFLARGISDNHPLVVIATEPHRRIVTSRDGGGSIFTLTLPRGQTAA